MVNNWHFEYIPTTQSTNSDLMERWRSNLLEKPVSRMADVQTAGRGRRGNQWISESGQSLTFSMAYPFTSNNGMQHLSGLSLACGLGLLYGLAEYFKTSLDTLHNRGVRLKWPNDVLVNNAKLSGILVEGGQPRPNESIWMIVGIGINLKPLTMSEPAEAYRIANLKELFPNTPAFNATELWHSLSNTFLNVFQEFNDQGFKAFQADWNEWNAFDKQPVELRQEGQVVQAGICQGVDTSGALIINSGGNLKTIHNGELSLRLNS